MSKCVLCEKEFYTIHELFDKQGDVICEKCRARFETTLKKTSINGITVYYLFDYTEEMMSALITLKGVGIKEMADALILPEVRRKLRKKFKKSVFLYMPSTEEDDEERGFRHVEVLFHDIAKGYYPLTKIQKRKQALCSYTERQEIIKYLKVNDNYEYDSKQSYIVVDDVITSGSTVFSAAKLLGLENFSILVLLFNHFNHE